MGRALTGLCLLVIMLLPFSGMAGPETPGSPIPVEILAYQRVFTPSTLVLRLGTPVILVIRNEDEDIHAFAPVLLFHDTNVQIEGNGAPEFDEQGFIRVLIPPHGKAQLRFIPKKAGTFFYSCDMPGHVMAGEILVQ